MNAISIFNRSSYKVITQLQNGCPKPRYKFTGIVNNRNPLTKVKARIGQFN